MLQCKIYPVCQIYEHIKKIINPGKLQMDYMQYWADPPHLRCGGGNYVLSVPLAIKQQESGMQDTYACSINMANSDIAVTKSLSQKVF